MTFVELGKIYLIVSRVDFKHDI